MKDRHRFGKFIEETKGNRGGADNYTYQELLELAEVFKEMMRKAPE